MYKHYLFSVERLDEMVEVINTSGEEISAMASLPQTGQMIIITKGSKILDIKEALKSDIDKELRKESVVS